MQIHTFIADSANEAVDQIRKDLGPAAVVLSVRKLPRAGLDRFLKQEQIEVLAGIEEPAKAEPRLDPLAELKEEVRQLRKQVAGKERSYDRAPGNPNLPTGGASYTSLPIGAPGHTSAASRAAATYASHPATPGGARPISSPSSAPDRKPSGIAHILNQTGLLPAFSELIVQEMREQESLPIADQITAACDLLRNRWRGGTSSTEAAVHVFVGVPGSGKSTVLCKMLAQTSLVEGQPATVYQLDSHIANAASQPGVYAEIVGAQFERTAPLNFERREESVYVDLPGVPLQNGKALAQLEELIASFGVPEVHLVLNGAYESAHLLEQVRFFSALGITDLVVTHLDEETRWGKLWNLVLGTNYCIRSLSCGQNVPGEFHPANPDRVLARQFRGK